MTLGGFNRAADQIDRREGPRRIVDKHDIRFDWNERLEPSQNALLTARAPDRRRPKRDRQRGSPQLSP
jgi:hypothetical protein